MTLRSSAPGPAALGPSDGATAALLDGDAVIAEARPAEVDVEVPVPVSAVQAEDATTRFVRIGNPAFRECRSAAPARRTTGSPSTRARTAGAACSPP